MAGLDKHGTRGDGDALTSRSRGLVDANAWVIASAGVVLAWLVIIGFTFTDYGITWDEEWHADNGEGVIAWYQSGFRDRDVLKNWLFVYYGGLFDVLGEITWRLTPLGRFEARHLLNAIFGVAGLVAAFLLSQRLESRFAGFLAVLFLVLTPVYYGHSFNNPKDLPFAVLYLFSLYGIVRVAEHFPRTPWRIVLATGVAIGATMAVRIAGIVLFGYLGFAFTLWLAHECWRRRRVALDGIVPFVARLTGMVVLAWVVMLPWWPSAQSDPLHPLRALRAFSDFESVGGGKFKVFFDGQDIATTELPRIYVPKIAALTLPEFVLLGLCVAVVLAAAAIAQKRAAWPRVIAWATIALAILFMPAWAAANRAVLYDGIRHMLFAVPPAVVVAATACAVLLRRHRPLGIAVLAVAAVSIGITAIDMVRLHPHQYIYFNRLLAGGVAQAGRSYELDYWGNSYKEGVEWVVAQYGPGDTTNPWRVATCSYPLSVAYFLPEGYRYVRREEGPDVFVATPRWHCDSRLDGRVVHTITRMGAPLLFVKEISARAAAVSR